MNNLDKLEEQLPAVHQPYINTLQELQRLNKMANKVLEYFYKHVCLYSLPISKFPNSYQSNKKIWIGSIYALLLLVVGCRLQRWADSNITLAFENA